MNNKLDASLAPTVLGVLILDSEGNRIIAKYYKGFMSGAADQAKFEQKLFKKTKNNTSTRSDADVILLDNMIVIFRCGSDTRFYVIGSQDENEIILDTVLSGLFTALNTLLRGQMEGRNMLDNLETVMLAVDELVDGGIILEIDPQSIVNRVLMRSDDTSQPLADMSMSQAIATAKDQLFKSMGTRDSDSTWG
ncbi:hypothetical protein CTAYLR_005648 [Chrysophaeum taylorii]|uniref:Coatomer subunit zeta n=1 Tax=Chrysophaeum taylorii TaxID=2483200 RepID=A0AAD7XSX6_9STRA|nr:hypothetical protein CTAYLR_005648 [Chrysophaeum taylorii]